MPMHNKKVAVVTAFPPSQTTLNEYGLHLVSALASSSQVGEVVALVENVPAGCEYVAPAGTRVVEAWCFNSVFSPFRILRTLRRERPDVVVFNLHFSSFGSARIPAALGLMTPMMTRLARLRTVSVLHNIIETVDLSGAGFSYGRVTERLMRFVGTALTWLLLKSHVVTTTLPRYVEILRGKYGANNVVLAPHGSFETPPPPPDREKHLPARILAFGKFGTYKKVEPLIEAFHRLQPGRNIELVIAGTDSPNAPGYLADVEARLGGPGITFTGYVAEEDVAATFQESAVAVFPYTSTTGSSGVLHQAGSYGSAVVLPDIGDLAELLTEEGYAAELFEADDPISMAGAIARILDDPEYRRDMGMQNYHASCGVPISEVADWIMLHAGLPAVESLLGKTGTNRSERMVSWSQREMDAVFVGRWLTRRRSHGPRVEYRATAHSRAQPNRRVPRHKRS